MQDLPNINANVLLELVNTRMPFGKYKGVLIADLPDAYLEWFLRKDGFPAGKLGQLMATVYEINLNGLQDLLKPLRNQ